MLLLPALVERLGQRGLYVNFAQVDEMHGEVFLPPDTDGHGLASGIGLLQTLSGETMHRLMRRKWSTDDSRFVEPHHIHRARSPRSAASSLSVVTNFREIP